MRRAGRLCRQLQRQHSSSRGGCWRALSSVSTSAQLVDSKPFFSSRAKIADACLPWLKQSRSRCMRGRWRRPPAGGTRQLACEAGPAAGCFTAGIAAATQQRRARGCRSGRSRHRPRPARVLCNRQPACDPCTPCCAHHPTPPSALLLARSNLEKTFSLEELYDGDISSVQIATCRANSEKVVIKAFKRDKLADRVDLQHKARQAGGSSRQQTQAAGSSSSVGALCTRPIRWPPQAARCRRCLAPKHRQPAPACGAATPFSYPPPPSPSRALPRAQVKQEWEVHSSLVHPNIITAYLGMEDAAGVKLFMEYAGESDAYSYINAKQRLCLREDDARQLVHDVLTALEYMHAQVARRRRQGRAHAVSQAARARLSRPGRASVQRACSEACSSRLAGRRRAGAVMPRANWTHRARAPPLAHLSPCRCHPAAPAAACAAWRLAPAAPQGIVHRDIKSENVFRTASGVWKLGDFGSSLRIGDERQLNRQVLKLEGTFSFAAPEYVALWSAFSRQQLLDATSFKVCAAAPLWRRL